MANLKQTEKVSYPFSKVLTLGFSNADWDEITSKLEFAEELVLVVDGKVYQPKSAAKFQFGAPEFTV